MAQMEFFHFMRFLLILTAFDRVTSKSSPCLLREAEYGDVCVCHADYCDSLDNPTLEHELQFAVVSSSKAGLRFGTSKGSFTNFKKHFILDHQVGQEDEQKNSNEQHLRSQRASDTRHVLLNITREKQFQKMVGFGGAFTMSVAHLMDQLPQGLQDRIYESYYSDHGLGYNLMRITIGGCDFDLEPWAYNEQPEKDVLLTNFSLNHRDELRIKKIRRLMEVSGVKNLRIKGAAWSSPRWMKSNNKWTGRSSLKEEFYQTWADYHLKWIEMMVENGLPIWAISTGNEPLNGVIFMDFVKFMSLGWTPQKQAIWVNENLGPTLRNSKHKNVLILGNDDQRFTLPTWFDTMNSTRAGSLNYLDGIAVHWYWDELVQPSFLDRAHEKMPDKLMLVTESCIGDKPWQKAKPLLGSWERGEMYARLFLQNLQHNVNGWIDWNLMLDEKGGPNYVDNTVDAPVIVNMANTTEVFKQPMFYAIGHFSKFVPENSIRIEVKRSNVNIDSVAFLRPDGTIAAVLFNSGKASVDITLNDSIRGVVALNVPPKSIHTIIYQ